MPERRRTYHKGRWAIQRERFQIADLTPPIDTPDAQPISQWIKAVISQADSTEVAQKIKLDESWPQLVGPQLAAHVRPVKVDKGTLFVGVDHPMWIQELKGAMGDEILHRIQVKHGADSFKKIRWIIDPDR